MNQNIQIKQLTEENIPDYEQLTRMDDGRLCYCSFWHQKFNSVEEYDKVKKENPERLKNCVIDRVKSKFHVGVIAYLDGKPCAWVSVGPLIDFFWTWKRVAHVGEKAKDIAGIMCFTIAPEFRGQGLQAEVLNHVANYGKSKGWTSIEAYPFSDSAIEKYGSALAWPGRCSGYEKAGFHLLEDHWLSSPDAQRLIYKLDLN